MRKNRMALLMKKIVGLCLILGLLLVYNNCTNGFAVNGFAKLGNTITGNPLTTPNLLVAKNLAQTICQFVTSCAPSGVMVTTETCYSGIQPVTNLPAALGIVSGYSTMGSVIDANLSGTLNGSVTAATTCAVAVSSQSCSSASVQNIYSTGSVNYNAVVGVVPATCASSLGSGQGLYVGGVFSSYAGVARGSAAHLNSDGSLDASFSTPGAGFDGKVLSMALTSSGNLVFGGRFNHYNTTFMPGLEVTDQTGAPISSFLMDGDGLNGEVESMVLDSNGKIVAAGDFSTYSSSPVLDNRVARVNIDGSQDTSFGSVGTGVGNTALAVKIDANGKVVLGGTFQDYNGAPIGYIARLNSDGSLDTSFASGTGFDLNVYSIVIDSSGKIIVGGGFGNFNGVQRTHLARLNSDGSLDTSFTLVGGGANADVKAIALDASGNIIIGGIFTSVGGSSLSYIARLKSNGSVDPSFVVTGSGLDGGVTSLAVDSVGKILVGGQFSSYNGVSSPGLVRLNADGSLDTGFVQSGVGFNAGAEVDSILLH